MTKKRIFLSAAFTLAAIGAFAQGNGSAGITEATSMVTSYFDPATKLQNSYTNPCHSVKKRIFIAKKKSNHY
jgi:hypothetical protein